MLFVIIYQVSTWILFVLIGFKFKVSGNFVTLIHFESVDA